MSVQSQNIALPLESDAATEPNAKWVKIFAKAKHAVDNGKHDVVDPVRVRKMKGQPREFFDPEALARMREGVTNVGQIYDAIVRPVKNDKAHDYELIDGESRWKTRLASGGKLRVFVVDVDDDEVQFVIAVIANSNRSEHTPYERFMTIVRCIDDLKMPPDVAGMVTGVTVQTLMLYYEIKKGIPDLIDAFNPVLSSQKQRPVLKVGVVQKLAGASVPVQRELLKKIQSGEIETRFLDSEIRAAEKRYEARLSVSGQRSPGASANSAQRQPAPLRGVSRQSRVHKEEYEPDSIETASTPKGRLSHAVELVAEVNAAAIKLDEITNDPKLENIVRVGATRISELESHLREAVNHIGALLRALTESKKRVATLKVQP